MLIKTDIWKKKKMSLEIIALEWGHEVKNVEGSSVYRANYFKYQSWKKLWESETEWEWSRHCANRNCQARPYGGSHVYICLLYTSPSPRDGLLSRMPSSA